MNGVNIHPDDFGRIDAVVQTVEASYRGGQTGDNGRDQRPPPRLLRCVLAQPLDDGDTAVAQATRYLGRSGYDAAIVGENGGGTYRLRVRRLPDGDWQESEPIDADATAAQAADACRPIRAAGPIDVGLGRICHPLTGALDHDGQPFVPGRWSFHFPEADVDVQLVDALIGFGDSAMQLRQTLYGDAGWAVEVHNAIPIGTPTPLRAGAVVVCAQFAGAWGVISAEPRDFAPVGSYYHYGN